MTEAQGILARWSGDLNDLGELQELAESEAYITEPSQPAHNEERRYEYRDGSAIVGCMNSWVEGYPAPADCDCSPMDGHTCGYGDEFTEWDRENDEYKPWEQS